MNTFINLMRENWKVIILVFIAPLLISKIIRLPMGPTYIYEKY